MEGASGRWFENAINTVLERSFRKKQISESTGEMCSYWEALLRDFRVDVEIITMNGMHPMEFIGTIQNLIEKRLFSY